MFCRRLRKNTCSSMPIKQRTKAQYRICTARNVFVLFLMILAMFIYILLNVHQPTTSFVLRNVQYLTYPILKIIRYLSVRQLSKYFHPLTENPYFYVADMECWPGENVHVPFIVKTQQKLVTAQELQQMYKENKKILDLEARRVKSTNLSISILQDVFEHELRYLTPSKTHISWLAC
ncbi:hypothetical protein NQ317_013114 [Molorchus minor]|uniref:Uncharacterized protein n=1 Tax=Molorchus minor TaxID=1323400 RepID=A0ABQ9JWF6_9CUCU|nr:hypothetical protein NQ317_013114 [Molorchus minor]